MDDTVKNVAAENAPEDEEQKIEAEKDKLKKQIEDMRKRTDDIREAMSSGKGRLKLETPIKAGDKELDELVYDFTELTGMEYADAMDADPNAQQAFKITYRQALQLFARATAKQMPEADTDDIVSQIGAMDAVEAVELATLFFNASTRAGRMRISKKS